MLTIDRERALARTYDRILSAWQEFDTARDHEPPISTALQELLEEPLPEQGVDVTEAIDDAVLALNSSLAQARPRYLAYVGSSGLDIGAIGDLLAHSYDPNLALHAGAASRIEDQTLQWLGAFVGYPVAAGSFTSGGTISNITALAAARVARFPDSRVHGLAGPVAIYCSADAHYSITRAAELLGLGSSAVRAVPVDINRRLDVGLLRSLLQEDGRRGVTPLAVVGTAGTTLTGAIDPLADIADLCASHGVWFHVDGAYGLPAASVRGDLFAGLSQADSVTVDAHKWMFVPKACGVLMVRDAQVLQSAFGHETSYLPGVTNPVDSTLEYSRPLRALKLWLALRVHGADGFRLTISHTIDLAQQLATQARQRGGWTVGPMGELSIAILRRDGVDNAALVRALQEDGRVFVSHARIAEETWIRPCFTNPRTTASDALSLLDVAEEIAAGMPRV